MPLRINGELIADELLREEERLIRPRLIEEMPGEDPLAVEQRVRQWALENVLERTVLRQEALKDAEPVAPEAIEQQMEQVRSQTPGQSGVVAPVPDDVLRQELEVRFRVERLVGRVAQKVSAPKNKDISDFYVKNREQFKSPEMLHAAHIVKNVDEKTDEASARSAIEAAREELQSGASFEELADRFSDCPGRGGDLGFFPRGQMVEQFEEVVFQLEPGKISEIFQTPFGFHIAKVYARKPEGVRGLDEVKEQIAQMLLEQKRQRATEQFLDRLMARAKVEEVT
ncbi:MAG TPA: peptidylprolyl isomerase [Bryobacteraceae bacterium]|nr:peptidylprolyl isomerase [Bryobacteraceae bacterium]